MYEQGYLGRPDQIATPTREKETFYLNHYIVPRWGDLRLNQIQPQAVEDWLHTTFDSWWTMHGVRAIMVRVYRYAEGHGAWEEGKRSPVSKAKLGKKYHKNERRILSFEETARVLARLEEPNKLVIETCIATGARISEVLGLKWKHVDLTGGYDQDRTARVASGGRPPEERRQPATSGNWRLAPAFPGKERRRGSRHRSHGSSIRSARRKGRSGTRASGMLCIRRRQTRIAISPGSDHTRSDAPILVGGNRWAAALLKPQRSPATAILR